jgi:damage-control phosphatase, subfamily I
LERIMRRSLSTLATADWSRSPMSLGAEVRRIAREETGIADPYAEIKARSNREALAHVDEVRARIAEAEDPLDLALAAAIAGNVIDYGSRERFPLDETLASISAQAFSIDDREMLRGGLTRAESVGFLADNAGEIVFDRLLIETIFAELGEKRVVFVLRREPFINDALIADARAAGFEALQSVELRQMNPQIPGQGDEDWETWRALRSCDVIISKGQGNYEAFSSMRGVYFLLMTKCAFVARDLALQVGHDLGVGEMILWRRP